jgi:hypothetical protein
MNNEREKAEGKLEEALTVAMRAIDNQIARAMQRTPAEREVHGVSKWEPYESRVENVTAFILNQLGENEVSLDSVFVFAQAFTKVLRLASEDLGADGLGKVRTEYCIDTMEKIASDSSKTLSEIRSQHLT